MQILTLQTGLFNDADTVIEAAAAPVIDLRNELNETDWDNVIDQIMDADLIVTA